MATNNKEIWISFVWWCIEYWLLCESFQSVYPFSLVCSNDMTFWSKFLRMEVNSADGIVVEMFRIPILITHQKQHLSFAEQKKFRISFFSAENRKYGSRQWFKICSRTFENLLLHVCCYVYSYHNFNNVIDFTYFPMKKKTTKSSTNISCRWLFQLKCVHFNDFPQLLQF